MYIKLRKKDLKYIIKKYSFMLITDDFDKKLEYNKQNYNKDWHSLPEYLVSFGKWHLDFENKIIKHVTTIKNNNKIVEVNHYYKIKIGK